MSLEQHAKQEAIVKMRLEALEGYLGDDRVIKSEEIKAEIALKPKIPTVYSGFPEIDKTVGGFRKGELVIVSGPTGMGKTTFCQSLTYQFAEQGISPLWFSFEVVADDLIERFGSNLPAFVLPREIKAGTLEWIEERIWEGLAKFSSKIVFIDHLHYLLDMQKLSGMNTSLAIGSLMREIKLLALRTSTTIFLISHLKKTRSDVEPEIGDLRDSSFVGQESDMVFVVWRTKKIDPKTDRMIYGDTLLKVEKNRRKGELKTIPLIFEKNRLFETVDSYEENI